MREIPDFIKIWWRWKFPVYKDIGLGGTYFQRLCVELAFRIKKFKIYPCQADLVEFKVIAIFPISIFSGKRRSGYIGII